MNIVKRDKRNPFTRLLRGNDKEATATWMLEFDRILRVFKVRSIASAWSLLTPRSQAEPVINKHPTDPKVRGDITNARTTASDIHRDKLRSREEVGGQNQAVGLTHTLIVTE